MHPGTTLDGRYRIIDLVGEGTFAYVYRARHLVIDTLEIAIKILKRQFVADEELHEQFVREAETVALLRNQHTVRVTDMGRLEDGRPYICMEFCSGFTLNHLMRLYGYQPVALIAHIADSVLQSLSEAHDLGIIHRDIKPSNIIITDQALGRLPLVRVLDFGIAHAIQAHSVTPDDESSNFVFCTPSYAAPEVLNGRATKSADLYALGLTLAELIEGEPVYPNNGFYKVAAQQTSDDPVPFGPLTRKSVLFPIIERACQKEPSQRFQSATEMLQAIRAVSDHFDYTALRIYGAPAPIGCGNPDNCAVVKNFDALIHQGRCDHPSCNVQLNPSADGSTIGTPDPLRLDDFGTLQALLDESEDALHFEFDAFETYQTQIFPRIRGNSSSAETSDHASADAEGPASDDLRDDAPTAPIPHRASAQTDLYDAPPQTASAGIQPASPHMRHVQDLTFVELQRTLFTTPTDTPQLLRRTLSTLSGLLVFLTLLYVLFIGLPYA